VFFVVISLIWLALMAFVVAACQVAARTDRRTDTELKRLDALRPVEWARSTVRSPRPVTQNVRRGVSRQVPRKLTLP